MLRENVLPVQVQLLGQSISVGRPSGYVDPSRAQEAAAAAAAALQAFQVSLSIEPESVSSRNEHPSLLQSEQSSVCMLTITQTSVSSIIRDAKVDACQR